MSSLGTIVVSVLGGGLGMRLLDHLVSYLKQRAKAKRILDQQLDPLLKAADELVGKVRSLAAADFESLFAYQSRKSSSELDVRRDLQVLSYLFLFAQFWARIEILRLKSLYVDISQFRKGKRLLEFLRSMEARRSRLLSRAWQRVIGESLVDRTSTEIRCQTLAEFCERYEEDERFRGWIQQLEFVLVRRIGSDSDRQRVLKYGAIAHAMIDTLDSRHRVTRNRPSFPNKLKISTRRDLKYRVFGLHLHFVPKQEKYLGSNWS